MKNFKRILMLATATTALGCATGSHSVVVDSKVAEKARPFLAGYRAIDLRQESVVVACAEPKTDGKSDGKTDADWKAWVAAADACVRKEEWSSLEKIATEMASRHLDSPWGPYFLGLVASARGEYSRAQWMLDLAEKKAGGALGIVRYEKARMIEKEEGVSAAAKEMKLAVQLDPTLVQGQLWLAQVHHRDRMLSEAEGYYRQALAVKGDLWSALNGLADVEIDLKRGPEAADLLVRAITLRPEIAETRVKLAFVYETLQRDSSRALQTLRELKVALERGRTRGRVGFDLNQKIHGIEQTMKTEANGQALGREPAQKKGG